MTTTLMNPPTVMEIPGISQIAIASGAKQIHLSGQTALTPVGELVGGDNVGAQFRQCLANVRKCLEAGGASETDIVKLTVYVVDYSPEDLDSLAEVLHDFFGATGHAPAVTLVGVQALFMAGVRVEVDVVAAVD